MSMSEEHRRLLNEYLEANHRQHEETREVFNANVEATDRYIIRNRAWNLINTLAIVLLFVLRACA